MEQQAKNIGIHLVLLLIACCTYSCGYNTKSQNKNEIETDTLFSFNGIEVNRNSLDSLTAQLPKNMVRLDTLLQNITKQQNVRVLADLNETQADSEKLITTYSGNGYTFKLKIKTDTLAFPSDMNDENTIFYDGKKKIIFRNYKVTGYDEGNYEPDNFGFNTYHSFVNPQIIEVCGKKFLYSALSFPCNGIGCRQALTMIYDIQEKTPTFVSNYDLPFTDYLLSDFDNDGVPDLLVTAALTEDADSANMSSDIRKFRMKLLAYRYDKGTFKFNKDNSYDLYTIGNLWCTPEVYSVEKDSWFKTKKK